MPPGYDADALEVLKGKKKGNYNIVAIDPGYEPQPLETRTVFGVTFEQGRQDLEISDARCCRISSPRTRL